MTSFDEIIDTALVTIDDYKLNALYAKDEYAFYKFCDGLLIRNVPSFYNCRQSLEYDKEARCFVSDFDIFEKDIIVGLFTLAWWEREFNNGSQIQNTLITGSFKKHSGAQHIKQMRETIDGLREEIDRKMTNYELRYSIGGESNGL